MYKKVEKTKENKTINPIAQKKKGDRTTFQFIDNRPEATAQKKIQRLLLNKPQDTLQRTMRMTHEATTVAPLTRGQLLSWLKKTASPGVNKLLQSPNVDYNIRFDNTIGPDGDTSMRLQYTDGVGAIGNINLFNAASVAVINGLNYPLQNFEIQLTTSVKTGGRLQMTPPAAANATTTWQGTLNHEIETHTGLGIKTLDILTKMNTARTASLPSLKQKIINSMRVRTSDAEHKNLASGNATLAKAQEDTVLKAATHNEKVDILVDIVTDRVKHIGWFIVKDTEKKLALRDAKSFLVKTADKIGDLVAADTTRIDALKGWIDGEMP